MTERSATRIIDLLRERPGVTDESRRSPDSVLAFAARAFKPLAVAPATTPAAARPPLVHASRSLTRLRPILGPHSTLASHPRPSLPIGAPRREPPHSAPAARSKPFQPIVPPRAASATRRKPLVPRPWTKASRLAPLPHDDRRGLAASGRIPFAGLTVQGSCSPSWTSHTLTSTTLHLLSTRLPLGGSLG